MSSSRILAAIVLCSAVLTAREDPVICGTHSAKTFEELARHKRNQAEVQFRLKTAGARSSRAAVEPDRGDIAVLSDTEGVVARRNSFNLNGRLLRFVPESTAVDRYRLEVGEGNYDAAVAEAGEVVEEIGDDDSRRTVLPFSFPFFGRQWNAAYVNSDGNLTFGRGEAGTTDRSLGRLHGGPPRIAGLFRDLDPSVSGAIRVTREAGRVVFSWVNVREYSATASGVPQRFQIRLYANGTIEYAFDTRTSEAVVGITPGADQGSPQFVTLTIAPPGPYASTVAERFTDTDEVDVFTAAQRFYLNHEDAYDYLVFFNSAGIPAAPGAVAFELTVRNRHITGVGDQPLDLGTETGSKRRLRAIMNMGPLIQYPDDPNAIVPARGISGDTTLTVLGHEAGHLFLALASVRGDESGNPFPLLGRSASHWAFTFNSEASLLEGNRIEDRGPGANPRFLTTATVEGFSPFDLYLMGMLPPDQVGPMFYVANASTAAARAPQVGIGISGTRRDFSVDEVIAVEGRRSPDSTVAQRRFRFAFVLIKPESEPIAPETIRKIDLYRQSFDSFFVRATREQGRAETSLKRALQVSLSPAGGVTLGSEISATLSMANKFGFPLSVFVKSRFGNVEVPEVVMVPPGANTVSFAVRGIREGVDELEFRAYDASFETVEARVQVSLPENTTLVRLEANPEESGIVRVRLTDVNLLPYPCVRIVADGQGLLGDSVVSTDADGVAEFRVIGDGSNVVFRAETGPVAGAVVPEISDINFLYPIPQKFQSR